MDSAVEYCIMSTQNSDGTDNVEPRVRLQHYWELKKSRVRHFYWTVSSTKEHLAGSEPCQIFQNVRPHDEAAHLDDLDII